MSTDREVALTAAVRRLSGVSVVGPSHDMQNLAKAPLALADLFLTWLREDDKPADSQSVPVVPTQVEDHVGRLIGLGQWLDSSDDPHLD